MWLGRVLRDVFGPALGDDAPAAVAAFGAEVDHPVGGLDHVEVVLDDDDRVAVIAQAVQHAQQQVDVVEVETGRRLVEDVERAPGVALGQLERELHALRFAARERRRALAERDVAEAHVEQRLELSREHRHRAEEFRRLLDRHLQHFVDVLALVLDLERLAVVAVAVADVARHVDVGQEMHLDLEHAVALARFAAPAFHVEGEASGAVAALARGGHAGEELAYRREEPGVGRRIRARRAPDRALVDVHDLVEELEPRDRFVRRRLRRRCRRAGARPRCTSVSLTSVDLPEPETPVTHTKRPTGMLDRDVLQVVAGRARDRELPLRVHAVAQPRQLDAPPAAQVLPGERFGMRRDLLRRALRDDASAVLAGAQTHVDDVVGAHDRFLVVLDDDHRVADVAQALQRVEEPRRCRAGAARSTARRGRT